MTEEDYEEIGTYPFEEGKFNIAMQIKRNGAIVAELNERLGKIRAYQIDGYEEEEGKRHI